MSDTMHNNDELSFEERVGANFGGNAGNTTASATSERLKEVSKKLPKWDLEPPVNFLK